jgi:hypothetical protein
MAPQSLLDDQWEDFEEPNMGPQNSSNIEREYGDYPRMSPESFLDSDWQDYGDPQMSPQYILDLECQGDDNLQMEPQPPLGNESGGQEQTGSHLRVPGQDGGGGGGGPLLRGARRYKNPILSDREVKDIRVKWAAGWTLNMIHEDFYPGSSVNSIKVYLRKDGWKAWTTEEDTKLRGMESQAGATWPQIRAQFSNKRQGVRRDEEEIQARLEHLKQPQNAPKRQKHSIFIFSPDDDRYITSSVAQGKMWEEQRKERFPQMSTYSIRTHAIKIGAFWDSGDDQKLQRNIPRQGMQVDWNSIAREYDPPRDVQIIKMRWEYLQRQRRKQEQKNAGVHGTLQSWTQYDYAPH